MPFKDKAAKAAYDAQWRAENALRAGWLNLKGNAKKRGQSEPGLTFEEYKAVRERPCVYCADYFRKPNEAGSGLDRLDNDQGYSPTNVRSCCGFCNALRSDLLTVAETRAAVQAAIAVRLND